MTMEEAIRENNSMLPSPKKVSTETFELNPVPTAQRNLHIMYLPSGQVLEIERADVPELVRNLRAAYNIP